MQNQGSRLFRQKALERLSSPEQLDQLMQVVDPKAWLPLATLAVFVVAGVTWSVVGRIPITVTGEGVLIRPRKVVQMQVSSTGTLINLKVKAGDRVKKGDVIGTIDQTELQKQLQQERAKLADLEMQNQEASTLQSQRQTLDRQAMQQQRQTLRQTLADAQKLTPILRAKGVEAIQRDRQNLQERLQALRSLLPTLKQRYEKRKQLLAEGAISDDSVLQTQQEYLNSLASIADAESQLKQLDVKEAEAERQYLQNLSSVADTQTQLRSLDSKEASQAQENLTTVTSRKNQIQDVRRNLDRLILQLQEKGQILSQYSGRILEVTAVSGQLLSPGVRLASLEVEDSTDQLVSVTYFTVADGKRIKPGMPVQVTPSTVKREQFGGIVGSVTTVSPFAATPEGAIALIGNEAIVKNLMAGGRQVEIFADLQLDSSTQSGYKWSSSAGPTLKISSGTTTQIRVKVGEQAPITYVIPLLKSMTGTY